MELDLFAACLPGLEPLLATELRTLGFAGTRVPGGVDYRCDRDGLLRSHLHLGLASHVLLRCGRFRCLNLGELQTRSAQLPWRQWLVPDRPFAVRATARKSRLYHTGAIEERVTRGITAALGGAATAAPDDPGVVIAARVDQDVVTLSLDTSDSPLHRRGYRLATAKAPLREDLACALLRAAGYTGATALLDPFCGAGTIAIEAATIALGLPAGRLRPAPLAGTVLADEGAWRALVAQAAAATPAARAERASGAIAASDRNDGAIAAARDNAERAGVAAAITFSVSAMGSAPWLAAPATAPRPLLVATNPPYGIRVAAGRDLGNLYQSLGHRLAALGDDVRLAILAHDGRLARRTGRKLQTAFATRHGGLQVAAMVG